MQKSLHQPWRAKAMHVGNHFYARRVVTKNLPSLWIRELSIINTGRRPRSLDEQLKKIKDQEAITEGSSNAPIPVEAYDPHNPGASSKPTMGQGTMTLAQRLSQTLKDPLRAPDFAGVVSRGEIEVDCHPSCKVISLKSRTGVMSAETVRNFTHIIQVTDANWYDRFSIFTGASENFCMGLDLRGLASCAPGAPGFAAAAAGAPGGAGGIKAARRRHEKAAQGMENLGLLCRLAFLIARSPKSRIAVLDGRCAGAGVGLALAHGAGEGVGKFRIATNRTTVSVQQAHFLGFLPSMGLSFSLPRLRGATGLYLALTGARINAADALFCGAATHFMPSDRKDKCIKHLASCHEDLSAAQVKAILDDFSTSLTSLKDFKTFRSPPTFYERYTALGYTDPTHLEEQQEAIQRCFGAPGSVEELLEALRAEDSPWARTTLDAVQAMSPTSLHVTFELLRRGRVATLEDSFRVEWRVARRLLFDHSDFYEGVRAFELDKDGAPAWEPGPASRDEILELFRPMGEDVPLDLSQDHLVKAHRALPNKTAH